jgi:hypothetical protein
MMATVWTMELELHRNLQIGVGRFLGGKNSNCNTNSGINEFIYPDIAINK